MTIVYVFPESVVRKLWPQEYLMGALPGFEVRLVDLKDG